MSTALLFAEIHLELKKKKNYFVCCRSQLASEAEESGAPVGQGKGKADKNKKAPKRPTGGKADAPEVRSVGWTVSHARTH